MMTYSKPIEALAFVKSGDRVFIQGAVATPNILIKALVERAEELKDVEVVQLHSEGEAPYADEKYQDSFKVNALFVGGNVRSAIKAGRASYVPVFLSEVPLLFRRKILPLDVALVHVSPPDKHGYCSLGTSVDVTRAAVDCARYVIAQINPQMPRTHGEGLIHVKDFSAVVEVNEAIPELKPTLPSRAEKTIAAYIAEYVEDGATLQMGIGAIPDAVLSALVHHKDLGVHTEMFSDGVIELVEKGIINNSQKRKYPGKIVSSFVMGSRKLYDFIDDNPFVNLLDASYVNDVYVIKRNPKVTAINSAVEVDITGQVCADSIGTNIYSGVGGQMDFIRGAALSDGGKPIIALPSTTRKGISRIVSTLKPGAGVVTTRANVHYIVTEFGVAELFGKNLKQRAKALIEIAHPKHQEELFRQVYDLYGFRFLES